MAFCSIASSTATATASTFVVKSNITAFKVTDSSSIVMFPSKKNNRSSRLVVQAAAEEDKPTPLSVGHKMSSVIAFDEISSSSSSSSEKSLTILVLHGILGCGNDLAEFCHSLASSLSTSYTSSDWKMVLVDLRNHGSSADREGLSPPHDLTNAARDLANLVTSLDWVWPDVVIGHSLGGKVALQYAVSCAQGDYGDSAQLPKQMWILDCYPGKAESKSIGEDFVKALQTLKSVRSPILSQEWLVDHLIDLGVSKFRAEWISSTLKKSGEHMTIPYNIDGVIEMFQSVQDMDYWTLLEHPPKGIEIAMVLTERWGPDFIKRLEGLAKPENNESKSKVSVHVVPRSGHWIYKDEPQALLEIMIPRMASLIDQEMSSLIAFDEIISKSSSSSSKGSISALVLHGVLGSGNDLAEFCHSLVSSLSTSYASSDWRMVLVDLRNHGKSADKKGLLPPHDMVNTAKDLANLVKSLDWDWPDIVIGHSLGGRVALQYALSCAQGDYGDLAQLPKQLWVMDALPGKMENKSLLEGFLNVLNTLQSVPSPIPSKDWLVDHLINLGVSEFRSEWIVSTLKKSGAHMTIPYNIDGVMQMFRSLPDMDYWPLLQHPPKGIEIAMVITEAWSPNVVDRLESLSKREIDESTGKVSVHIVPRSGHWIYRDQPQTLLEIMIPRMASLVEPKLRI